MTNWLHQIPEPSKLFLAWQAPDHLNDRFRWAVGYLTPSEGSLKLAYLQREDEFRALNQGRTISEAEALGYSGYPGLKLSIGEHDDVLGFLMRRLPPRKRSDIQEYRKQFRIAPAAEVSDFAMLAATEAKLPSDGFSVVDPLSIEVVPRELFTEIAGFRYYAKRLPPSASIGARVSLVAEPTNPKDPNAVAVTYDQSVIGYVNRLQADAFQHWLQTSTIQASIERLNGNADRPRAFMFVRVH